MELLIPDPGLFVWTLVIFTVVFLVLKKFAFKPIIKALNEREASIEQAIQTAEKAKNEVAQLKSDNEALLKEARIERDQILKEAKEMKEAIVAEAKKVADEEAKKMLAKAQDEIGKQKVAAINELKQQVATFSVEIAEKIINKQLENNNEQERLIAENIKSLEQMQKASLN